MTTWMHAHRGLIEGDVVGYDGGEWLRIRLTKNSPRASAVARGRGPVDMAGDEITVRRAFLREVKPS